MDTVETQENNPSFDYKHAFRYARNLAIFWNAVPYTIPILASADDINFGWRIPKYEDRMVRDWEESREISTGEIVGNIAGIVGLAAQIYVHAQLINHGNKWGAYACMIANVASIPLAIWLGRRSNSPNSGIENVIDEIEENMSRN